MARRSIHLAQGGLARRGAAVWRALARWPRQRLAQWLGGAAEAGASEVGRPLLGGGEIEALLQRLQAMGVGPGTPRPMHTARPGEADSPFVGAGLDFEELRPYAPGDDLRDVDWRAYARSGRAFVKRYREERQSTVYLVLDRGASMRFGTRCRLKVTQAAIAAAVFALAGTLRGAAVGLSTLGPDGVHRRARPGRRALMQVLEGIAAPCPPLSSEAGGDPHAVFAAQLGELEARVPSGARVLLLSDFRLLREDDLGVLARLAERCAVQALQVLDVSERALPRLGDAEFAAPGRGVRHRVDTDDTGLREAFAARARRRDERLHERLAGLGLAVRSCSTCDDLFDELAASALYG